MVTFLCGVSPEYADICYALCAVYTPDPPQTVYIVYYPQQRLVPPQCARIDFDRPALQNIDRSVADLSDIVQLDMAFLVLAVLVLDAPAFARSVFALVAFVRFAFVAVAFAPLVAAAVVLALAAVEFVAVAVVPSVVVANRCRVDHMVLGPCSQSAPDLLFVASAV